MRIALALLILGTVAQARDCESRCTSYWTTIGGGAFSYTDPFCVARCNAEAEAEKVLGFSSCDTWKAPATATYYWSAKATLERSHNLTEFPKDASHCHQMVDVGAMAATAYGVSQAAIGFWATGWKYANIAMSASSVAAYLAGEGVKHLLHCACTDAKYSEAGAKPNGSPRDENNAYYFSAYRGDTGKWAVSWGTAASKTLIQDNVKRELGGVFHRFKGGYFNTIHRATAELICDSAAYHNYGQGFDPVKSVSDLARNLNKKNCLMRVTRGRFSNAGLDDFMFANAHKKGSPNYSVFWGPETNGNNLMKQAEDGVPGHDKVEMGIFSSSRPTQATATCEVASAAASPGLTVSGAVLFRTFGVGPESLKRAVDKTGADRTLRNCKFSVEDRDFGPLKQE